MVKKFPLILEIQKIYVHETYTRLYLIGSDNRETKFRILKIDRTEPEQLIIHEEQVAYSFDEIKEIIEMVDIGNRTKVSLKNQNALIKNITAFGIIGFVKFLFGYYIILITKKRKVAIIGHHNVYKVEDSQMLYIPNNQQGCQHPEELRLLKMFQSVDLASNFYFSYSYELTNTLQHYFSILDHKTLIEYNVKLIPDYPLYAFKLKSNPKFTWNSYLLEPLESKVHFDWCVPLIHGFVKQAIISIFGRNINVTLIARRSQYYAGTRYLKRGTSVFGNVANEVETEQILQDDTCGTGLSINSEDTMRGIYSSYVQVRGSIPIFWCQEASKMVPKPPIILYKTDPFCQASGAHFNGLIKRLGTPIIILNLAKSRDPKKGEGVICDEFKHSIQYLNQFLLAKHKIIYYNFDLARMNRNKSIDVIVKLEEVCWNFVNRTSFYLRTRKGRVPVKSYQSGVVRSNCVDCLDRTNTAQFVIGKCAMYLQLQALGVLHPGDQNQQYDYDSDASRLLEDMYEEHGDVLAMQYGGSQLVHRVDTYRKISPWTSQSRDMMQTFSRYYSNAFSDAEKQNAINLFLGVYVPALHSPPAIWDLTTDFHLHNRYEERSLAGSIPTAYRQWYDLKNLQDTFTPQISSAQGILVEAFKQYDGNHRVDAFYEFYRPYEYTSYDNLFILNIASTLKDYMPNNAKKFSPFVTRKVPILTLPPPTAQHSTVAEHPSTLDDVNSMSSDDFEIISLPPQPEPSNTVFKEKLVSPNVLSHRTLNRKDRDLYAKYALAYNVVNRGLKSQNDQDSLNREYTHSILKQQPKLSPTCLSTNDSVFSVKVPNVSPEAQAIYKKCLDVTHTEHPCLDVASINFYKTYLCQSN